MVLTDQMVYVFRRMNLSYILTTLHVHVRAFDVQADGAL